MCRVTIPLLALIALSAVVTTGHAQPPPEAERAQDPKPRLKYPLRSPRAGPAKASLDKSALRAASPRRLRATIAATAVGETEPNDDAASADAVSLGEQGTGVIDPAGDADYWVFSAEAGTTLDIDVDASQFGSPLDPTLELLAPDGQTTLAFNDDHDGLDSRIVYGVESSGDYYIVIRAFADGGGSDHSYTINFATVVCPTAGEEEPNDTPASAQRVALGDQVVGTICPTNDADAYVFAGTAGTIVDLDVDASVLGSPLDAFLELRADDGTLLAFNNDLGSFDSRIEYAMLADGDYHAIIYDYFSRGGPEYTYTLKFGTSEPGSGDPVTTVVAGLDAPIGLAVASNGDLLVGEPFANRIRRVTLSGSVSSFASIQTPYGMAFDAAGDLLVASDDGDVYKITPQGQVTRFLTAPQSPFWIAVAPDGSIWLSDLADYSIRHYDPAGRFLAAYDATSVGGIGPGPIALSPAGELHFSNGSGIYKLVGGQPQLVFAEEPVLWAFAFDGEGNLYVPNSQRGRMTLHGPSGAVLEDPFAIQLTTPLVAAFGRDADGATNARLFVTDIDAGAILELNPAGVRAAGWPLGFTASVSVEDAVTRLLLEEAPSEAELAFLDGLGNGNGRYDVGDFRALLIQMGIVGSALAVSGVGR